jgi:hypothetical protein
MGWHFDTSHIDRVSHPSIILDLQWASKRPSAGARHIGVKPIVPARSAKHRGKNTRWLAESGMKFARLGGGSQRAAL